MEIFIIAAITTDGFVGRDEHHSSIQWRSTEDGAFFTQKTREARAVVMGSTTFRTMRRPMPDRKHYVLTSKPEQFADSDPNQVVGINASVADLIAQVAADGFSQLAVCGGASVNRQFLLAGLVDRLYLTIEPVLFGQGISLFDQSIESKFTLAHIHQLSDQTVVHELVVVK